MSKRYREVLEEVETPASRRAADRDVVAVADESHEPTTAVTADRPDEAGTGMATDDHDPGTAPGMGTGGGVATLVRPATTDMSSPKQETGRCERSEATSGGNSGTLRAQRATPTRPEDAQQLQRVRRTRADEPLAFTWRGRRYAVTRILGHWREEEGWWRRPDGEPIRIEQSDLWRVEAVRGAGVVMASDGSRPGLRDGRGVYELAHRGEVWRLDRIWD